MKQGLSVYISKVICLCLLATILSHYTVEAQQTISNRPKVGVTLSGGGARGLAHIGILEAIDSAGLKVDLLTGTSMGSIIGGLYAMGYSGKQIEAAARKLNWNSLFTNQPVLNDISYEEKREYARYIIEIPFEYGKPKLASGVISGEALWLELAKLCWPVKDVKKFEDFSIPFKCIATDVATGEIVTLDSGEIVTSLRASMAIPSIFTAVKIGNRKLVDGGVVRNFPVITAKDMGADIVIGSNVSGGLRKEDQLLTPFDILYQLGFYKDADDFKKAITKCDIYVPVNKELENYSAASFGSVDSIIEAGQRKGRELYPVFKHLADSLNALYPQEPFVAERLPFPADIEISSIHVSGLVHSDQKFFLQRLHLKPNGCYTSAQLRNAILNVYGTRFYKLITYNLVPEGYGKSRMDITVEENPLTYVKVALNYNTLTGANAIVNLTQRNFIIPNSRSFVRVAISENPRLEAQYFKYLGRSRDFGFGMSTYYENNGLTFYDDEFARLQPYRSKYANANMDLQYMISRDMSVGAGTRWEYIKFKPQFSNFTDVRGSTNQLNTYISFGINSLNQRIYPTKGLQLDFEAGYVYNQHSGIKVSSGGHEMDLDSLGVRFDDYQRFVLNMKYYIPTGRKSALELDGNIGYNLHYKESVVNGYVVGGMNNVMRNQVPFVGLYEGEVITPKIAAVQVAWQYEFIRNLYAIPRVGTAVYDGEFTGGNRYKYLTGYGLGAGYSSRLGPVEATVMYSDQPGRLKFYVNMGFNF
ncbi:MAG: patatin-like phospholipase family protein [Chitinophaga sp.]|uniref:patatin-like phospholipase family protein n=1 Tax=Chitinophaga sp. TaxID=1869181 RepID=UPI001B150120|nr:patatin-like phospholipase family protein [Chitinophaga sp.]MBO9728395.1 patatin-like phospholipase family protein [Chitinophaga sp.]